MDEKRRAILRDYADGITLAEIAERHGLVDAKAAGTTVQALIDNLDERIWADLDQLYPLGESDSP